MNKKRKITILTIIVLVVIISTIVIGFTLYKKSVRHEEAKQGYDNMPCDEFLSVDFDRNSEFNYLYEQKLKDCLEEPTRSDLKEELLEIQNRHCSVFAKYNYNKEYLTVETQSIGEQRLDYCNDQRDEERSVVNGSTCSELSLISENNFEGIEFSNTKLIVVMKLDSCLNYEKHDANVGSCESLRQRYVTGEPYLEIANKLLTEQKLKDICHYDLKKEFGNIYE